jgi:hypothetical protein
MASKPRSAISRADMALNAPGTMTPRRASARALSCCFGFMRFLVEKDSETYLMGAFSYQP